MSKADTVKIGIIGDLDLERPSHRATNEALRYCAFALGLARHRFYVATLFQPQLRSTPDNPHKLITAFLACAGAR